MADPSINRTEVNSRISCWVKVYPETPEEELNLQQKAKLVNAGKKGKKDKKTERIWYIEYRWSSKKAYDKSPSFNFSKKKEYTTEWQHAPYGYKFISLKGAISSFGAYRKYTYANKQEGKDFRIRNIVTNEIYELKITPDVTANTDSTETTT